MTSKVEARSLASLNYLAGNPPQYPVNPTEAPQESLVLYISRVPGTRDVILSTFKPQRKNVTGEDVANSLYYVHVDNFSLLMPPAPIRDAATPRSSEESVRSANLIPRKPLPANTKVPSLTTTAGGPAMSMSMSAMSATSATAVPASPPAPIRPARHSAGAGYGGITGWPDLPDAPPKPSRPSPPVPTIAPVIRKPLGPRPMSSPRNAPERDMPPVPPLYEPSPYNTGLAVPRPVGHGGRFDESAYPDRRSPSPSMHHTPSNPQQSTPFSLTLIRRDPSSNNQWNVGKVSSPDVPDDEHSQPTIFVSIDTSGYAKFRGAPAFYNLGGNGTSSSASLNAALFDGDFSSESFGRQVVMTYSKSWAANIRQRFHRSESQPPRADETPRSIGPSSPHPLPGQHHRQDSSNSMGSMESAHSPSGGNEAALITQPGPGLKPKGYMFLSPWNGRCEFRTGNAGRSLKCRHIPESNGTSAYNPLVDNGHRHHSRQRSGGGGAGGNARNRLSSISSTANEAPVSELRFNLPNNDLFKGSSGQQEKERANQLHDQFNRFLRLDHQGHSPDEEDDGHSSLDEADFDWTMGLGREKAGGGNRGKRAKLGKLIVHEEGLKMLDLVVAANVGVWWSAWERSY